MYSIEAKRKRKQQGRSEDNELVNKEEEEDNNEYDEYNRYENLYAATSGIEYCRRYYGKPGEE